MRARPLSLLFQPDMGCRCPVVWVVILSELDVFSWGQCLWAEISELSCISIPGICGNLYYSPVGGIRAQHSSNDGIKNLNLKEKVRIGQRSMWSIRPFLQSKWYRERYTLRPLNFWLKGDEIKRGSLLIWISCLGSWIKYSDIIGHLVGWWLCSVGNTGERVSGGPEL